MSFWVNKEATPARMVFGVMTVLSLTTLRLVVLVENVQSNSETLNPKVYLLKLSQKSASTANKV